MIDIDLVCVAADQSIRAALEGLLSRHEAVGIRAVDFEVLVHPQRDPGCFHHSRALLSGYARRARRALVVLDAAWDGVPTGDAADLEQRIEASLAGLSSADWVRAVAIKPELETWVFSDSPRVPEVLGWTQSPAAFRSRLEAQGLWEAGQAKPADPKRAMDWALRQVQVPRSSSLFRRLASKVSFQRCQDRAFLRLLAVLQGWFRT